MSLDPSVGSVSLRPCRLHQCHGRGVVGSFLGVRKLPTVRDDDAGGGGGTREARGRMWDEE